MQINSRYWMKKRNTIDVKIIYANKQFEKVLKKAVWRLSKFLNSALKQSLKAKLVIW